MKKLISSLKKIKDRSISQTKSIFKSFSASSCDFFVYAFTHTKDWDEFLSIKQDVLLEIAKIISKNNAEIAYPTTTVILEHQSNNLK